MDNDFYNQHSEHFFESTIKVDMQSLYRHFVPRLKAGAHILDAGCGSGRDTLAFSQLGFSVTAFDASQALCALASDHCKQPIQCCTFLEFETKDTFDAIWACASLLHVPYIELTQVFNHLSQYLKKDGLFYCSFKYGIDEVKRDGRQFSNLTRQSLEQILKNTQLSMLETWQTQDLREGREDEIWLNAVLIKHHENNPKE